jgi:hypothetical protein
MMKYQESDLEEREASMLECSVISCEWDMDKFDFDTTGKLRPTFPAIRSHG